MKLLFKLFSFILFICLIGLPIIIILFGIDKYPIVTKHKALTFDNLKKAEQIIKDNRPQRLSKRQIKKISITENELNILSSYAISHGLGVNDIFAVSRLSDNRLTIFLTAQLKYLFPGKYINLRMELKPKNHFLQIGRCQIGQIKIPSFVTQPMISGLHSLLLKSELYQDLWKESKALKKIVIQGKTLNVHYTLSFDGLKTLKDRGRSFLIPDEQQKKLIKYHNHLSDLSRKLKHKKNGILYLTKDMIAFAAKNSKTGNDPVLENTSALQVLALYVIGQRLDSFLKKEYQSAVKFPVRAKLLFYNRTDLPKHFFVSAALAVSTGSRFASLVGLAKEIDDSDGGSGFSFADLAADKAGVRFGELAISSEKQALLFQEKLKAIRSIDEIMPLISNLPEGIMELEFKNRYRDLDSRAYQLINDEIDKRLNQCSLYRGSLYRG